MIVRNSFGKMPDGSEVEAITLENALGNQVVILTLGATIQQWNLATDSVDLVLGFDSVEDYLTDAHYIGRTVGRYANRIAAGKFAIDGDGHQVSVNQKGNSLHGGESGFHNRLWEIAAIDDSETPSVTVTLTSPDGDQGFPGTLVTQVTFTLDNHDCLTIHYTAECDKDTVFNPTQHTYFNLRGHNSGKVFDQQVRLIASQYTPADDRGIPTGEVKTTRGTPFDLSELQPFGQLIKHQHPEIVAANGLDHNWCIDGFDPTQIEERLAAVTVDPASGRKMLTRTSMPGLQVYTANFLGAANAKQGSKYAPFDGFCLESQFYPNSPNEPAFPSPVLRKGQKFQSTTSYQIVTD